MSLDHPRGPDRGQTHRVGRVRFDLSAAREGDLMVLRAGVEKAVGNALATALGSALDATAAADEVVSIDRVNIDLGVLVSGAEIDLADLTLATTAALHRTLHSALTRDPSESTNEEKANTPIWNDIIQARATAFVFYLRHGRLPAATPDPDLIALLAAMFETTVTSEVAHVVASVLRDNPVAVVRLVHVLDIVQITALFQAIAEIAPIDIAPILAILDSSPQGQTVHDPGQMLGLVQAVLGGNPPDAIISEEPTLGRMNAPRNSSVNAPDFQDVEDQVSPFTDSHQTFALPDAGLVILGPFLPAFFKGLCVDPTRDPMRAAGLLHALAHGGETSFAESDLLIARAICAIPDDVALVDQTPLALDDLAEVNALLEAVIGHWTRLGKTSVTGLRETFLTRPGLLSQYNGAPLITVETRGVDVLLGGLPWALTPLRLPWLDQPVPVDWV